MRKKDYSEVPQTVGEYLKKRRRELGLLQREAGERMGVSAETVANWERDKTKPVAAQFRPVIAFLGYDPYPEPKTLAERVEAKRRILGVTFEQVAQYLGWDEGSLRRYLRGQWRLSRDRSKGLQMFLDAGQKNATAAMLTAPRRGRSSRAKLAVAKPLGRR